MKAVRNPPPPAIGPHSDARVTANLQDALLFLVAVERFELTGVERAALLRERQENKYGDGTSYAVILFRKQYGLEAGEIVDETTAGVLNGLLQELGVLDSLDQDARNVVSGQVRQQDAQLSERTLVRAFHEGELGAIRLGEDTTDSKGRYTISYVPPSAVRDGVNLRIEVYGEAGRWVQSSEVIRVL